MIDDDAHVRAVTARMLKQFGFAVLLAQDGPTGVELFRSQAQNIVCVLPDMTMPQLDGKVVFRELRQIQPEVCAILMSGYTAQDVTVQFAGKGLAGFLAQPFTLDGLRTKLKQVLDEQTINTGASDRP